MKKWITWDGQSISKITGGLCFCLLFSLSLGTPSLLGQEREEIKKKIQNIFQNSRYQKKELGRENLSKETGNFSRSSSPPLSSSPLGGFFVSIFKFIFYFGCFLGLVILLYFLFQKIYQNSSGRGLSKSGKDKGNLPEGSSSAQEINRSHQDLAGEGLYLEALRQLFKKALDLVMGSGMFKGNLSWTNLEILRVLKKDPALHETFGIMAQAIERGYYAKQPISKQDYETCLENYQKLQSQIS